MKLQPPEQDRFEKLERIIEKGQKTFVEVGLAAAEIKVRKLWRATKKADGTLCQSFEEYTDFKFGWSRQYATKFLGAAVTVSQLPPADAKKITTVNAAAAVKNVPPAKRAAVIKAATAEGKPVTAASVKAAAKAISPPPQKKIKDETGLIVPSLALAIWARREEVHQMLFHISVVRSKIKAFQDANDPILAEGAAQSAQAAMDQAYGDVKTFKPYAVCPTCQAAAPEGCGLCGGRGVISQFRWDNIVTSEAKAMRTKQVEMQNELA